MINKIVVGLFVFFVLLSCLDLFLTYIAVSRYNFEEKNPVHAYFINRGNHIMPFLINCVLLLILFIALSKIHSVFVTYSSLCFIIFMFIGVNIRHIGLIQYAQGF